MPKLDGLQATKQLRANGYRRPILALSAHARNEDIINSRAAGCDEHITKPIARQALLAMVSKYSHLNDQAENNLLH